MISTKDQMGDKESDQEMEFKLIVRLLSDTPVAGCEINPIVHVYPSKIRQPPQPHSLSFSWYRDQFFTCCVHNSKVATVQCMSCVKLKIPVKESFHCSTKCYNNAWNKHLEIHSKAVNSKTSSRNDYQQGLRKHRSSGSWPDYGSSSLFDEIQELVEQERHWVKVGSSRTFLPSMDDIGFRFRMEAVVTDCLAGNHLSPICTLLTNPVISFPTRQPRRMFKIRMLNPCSSNPEAQISNGVTFRVLSYNILSDLYATRVRYSYCPTWALLWEYRRQNLLQEIIEYEADIICLQEVQSDHFDNFFKPELTKRGYSVNYKKKLVELFTYNKYVIDGCATFYRCDLFKEITKYELELNTAATSLVEALEPGLRNDGCIRLMKDNVALVVILEVLKNSRSNDAFQSRICVVNTHIHANEKLRDVKLFQVAYLVHGLEKIFEAQVPLLICGDFNSLPESDPHKFLVRRKIDSSYKNQETDPLGIYQLLKLEHSLPLVSAYASLFSSEGVEEQHLRRMDKNNKEPLFTNFSSRFSGTLDYILYTVNDFSIEGLLELLDPESVGVGLPSPLWSSDHVALMASFRLKPSSTQKLYRPPLPTNLWQHVATAC